MPTPKTTAHRDAASPPPAVPRPARARTATASRTKRTAATVTPSPAPQLVSEDDIRRRAYFRSLERGDGGADPVRDWLEAEQELAALMAAEGGVPVVARRRRTNAD